MKLVPLLVGAAAALAFLLLVNPAGCGCARRKQALAGFLGGI